MVGDERVGIGRLEQGRGREGREGMQAERMVGNARVCRVGEGSRLEGR